ncbi:hypothetical protein ACFSQE_06890 [Vogesella fluminis]|uniref:hypothetical protein n=1 Tax=Vogesella fluminis TaxID=1069161 RepID=UPI001679077D|nr:hypothetical protein [Vogesella fluminis]
MAQLGVMRRTKHNKQALDFHFPTCIVFKARQNVIFFAVLQIVYIDSYKGDPDNPYSLGCSNCFLIVSPLFLLCRLGAGVKPRAIFLPVSFPIIINYLPPRPASDTSCLAACIPSMSAAFNRRPFHARHPVPPAAPQHSEMNMKSSISIKNEQKNRASLRGAAKSM